MEEIELQLNCRPVRQKQEIIVFLGVGYRSIIADRGVWWCSTSAAATRNDCTSHSLTLWTRRAFYFSIFECERPKKKAGYTHGGACFFFLV